MLRAIRDTDPDCQVILISRNATMEHAFEAIELGAESGEVQGIGAVDSRRVDVHVLAATNKDLMVEIAAGRFRNDLYCRLNAIEIKAPAVRDRREDIPYLAAAFVRECSARLRKRIAPIRSSASTKKSNGDQMSSGSFRISPRSSAWSARFCSSRTMDGPWPTDATSAFHHLTGHYRRRVDFMWM